MCSVEVWLFKSTVPCSGPTVCRLLRVDMYWYNGNRSEVLQEVFTGYKMQGKIKIYLILPAYNYICIYRLLTNWSSVQGQGRIIIRLLTSFEETRCFRLQKRRLLPTSGWPRNSRSNRQCVTYTEVIDDIFCYEKKNYKVLVGYLLIISHKKSPVHGHE
jgi:hypothetical protein